MNLQKPCKCGGMNEECIFCSGSGYLTKENVEIIRLWVDPLKLKREKKDLETYLHPKQIPKLNVMKSYPLKKGKKRLKSKSKRKTKNSKVKAKKQNKAKIDNRNLSKIKYKKDPLKYIGPKNPNRKTQSETKQTFRRKPKVK